MTAANLPAHGRAVAEAASRLRSAFAALLDALDLADGRHDDAAEVIQRSREVAALGRELAEQAEERVLAWLRQNRHGHRDVVIGDLRYFGQREKREKVRDLPVAFGALARAELGEVVGAATYGDLDLAGRVFAALEQFAASFVSTSGLKTGACRAAIARQAEAELRAGIVEPSEQEVEAAGRAAFERLWEVSWPDALGDQPAPKETLGVANLRFLLHQTSDARTKKDLAAMLERAAVARRAALEREKAGEAWAGEGSAPGSWEGAVEGLGEGEG